MMSMGDNIYALNETHPTDEDVASMFSLFDRPNLKDLYIYAIRGNHDCVTEDPYFEVNFTKKYPTWRMPDLYYNRTFDIGNGNKFGALFVDTCLALCANYSYSGDTGGKLLSTNTQEQDEVAHEDWLLSPEFKNLRFGVVNCSDPFTVKRGEDMFKWINETLAEWKKDESVVWTASIQHHPMFSKFWSDYLNITSNLMPLL